MSTTPNGDPNIKPHTIVEGWIYDTGYRGTLDIIYGCLVVLVAAVWTVVHLNVPSQNDSDWRIFWRRLRWSLVSITAPDFLTLVAAAQWDCAQRSVKEMAKLPGAAENWTLVHAFYANSGGFVLEAPDYNGPDGRFPISAESVHYLVSRGYMPLPTITKEEIWDKSKADVFAKGLALLQSAWIFIMAIARTAQGLPLTPIELFTLAFVISTVMSYFFWWRKPQNVGTPTKLWCETTMARVRADAGYSDDQPYEDTPMDFVEKPSRYWKRRDMFADFDLESGRRKMESTVVELPRWDNASSPGLGIGASGFGTEHSSTAALVRPEEAVVRGNDPEITKQEQREMEKKGLISPSPLSSRTSTLVVPGAGSRAKGGIRRSKSDDILGIGIHHQGSMEAIPLNTPLTPKDTNERISFSSQQPQTPSNFQTVVTWTQNPIKRIPDDAIMAVRLPTKMVGFLMIPSMIHCSIHLAGWNHQFPTETEKILWRIAVIILTVMSSVSVGAVRLLGIKGYKGRYNLLWVWVNGNADPRTKGIWDVVLSWSTFMLILARFYLIVEVCISLRKLPAEVFYDVDWVNWIPHI
ncbi:hypothetical protein V8F06_005770 [Rhypophila decipiens]